MQIQSVVIRIEGKPDQVFSQVKKMAEEAPDKTAKQLFEELHRN